MRRTLALLVLAALCLLPSSCAVNGGGEQVVARAPAQPAARIGLQPAYRVFYDELAQYGDWALVEPYGWVFRPAVNFVAWRPYQDGYWTPSDYFGWIWNSTEPFGWITYHYGAWFYDAYQGWVWTPGPVWAPAWVAWSQVGEYIGWAPLPPRGYDDFSHVPGGVFTFVGARDFVGQGAGTEALFVRTIPDTKAGIHEIYNVGHAGGVAFNKGPDALLLRKLADSPPPHGEDPEFRRVKLSGYSADEHSEADLAARTRGVTAEAERELTQLREHGIAPPPAPNLGRPRVWRTNPPPLVKPVVKGAGRDSGGVKERAPGDTTDAGRNGKRLKQTRPEGKPGAAADSTRG